jgi:hypothetical protein
LIGIAALVAGLGACGGGSSDAPRVRQATTKDPFRLVAASADAAAQEKSAKLSMSMTVSAGGQTRSFTADGAFDFAARSGVLTMDMSSLGLPGGPGRMEVRVVDGVLYMNVGDLLGAAGPAATQELGGKHWFKLDASALTDRSTPSGLGALGSGNPTSTLDALRGVSSDVTVLGSDTVRGVDTTHYAVTIDLSKALDRVPVGERDAATKGLKMLGAGSVPAEVWIDGHGCPRKLVMNLGGAEGSGTSLGALTMEMYDYGTTVEVHAPPADDTVDMMNAFGGLLGGTGSGYETNGNGSTGSA